MLRATIATRWPPNSTTAAACQLLVVIIFVKPSHHRMRPTTRSPSHHQSVPASRNHDCPPGPHQSLLARALYTRSLRRYRRLKLCRGRVNYGLEIVREFDADGIWRRCSVRSRLAKKTSKLAHEAHTYNKSDMWAFKAARCQ